jgi:hypothetical protein
MNSSLDDEITQQQITHTLQEIDANFNKAHTVASNLLGHVQTFSQNMKQVHGSIQVRSSHHATARPLS